MVERVERAFRRGEDFDAVAVEQRAGAKIVLLQLLGDRIEIEIGRARIEPHLYAEGLGEDPVEPHPRRRGAKQVIVVGEDAPRGTRIGPASPDAQILQRSPLRIQHTKHVMVGMQQQLGRIAKRLVMSEPRRIGMPMRADDRQIGDIGIELARKGADAGLRREQAILMQLQWLAHSSLPRRTMVTGVKNGFCRLPERKSTGQAGG